MAEPRPTVQFPETVETEWRIVANASRAEADLRRRIERDTLVEKEIERLRIRHMADALFKAELAAESTPELEMMTLADYNTSPTAAPGDLIEGVVKDEGLTLMLGPSGSGKSTQALQMVYSLMTGDDWLGQKVTKIAGSVGLISYDMPGTLMLDWMGGFPNIDTSRVSMVNAYKQGNPLAVPAHRATIANLWKARNTEIIVIDSFSASFFGRDQNDAAEAQAHYRDLKKFALGECGARALVVIVHSTEGSPKKPRGSTVHQDVADSIVAVWAPGGNTGPRTVDMTKYRQHRDMSGGFTHQMTPRVITEPDAVTHLVGLDLGAMTLEGMTLPATSAAAAFTDIPDPIDPADTESSETGNGEDEDL